MTLMATSFWSVVHPKFMDMMTHNISTVDDTGNQQDTPPSVDDDFGKLLCVHTEFQGTAKSPIDLTCFRGKAKGFHVLLHSTAALHCCGLRRPHLLQSFLLTLNCALSVPYQCLTKKIHQIKGTCLFMCTFDLPCMCLGVTCGMMMKS